MRTVTAQRVGVAVIGTLDTKAEELGFLTECLDSGGVAPILINTGILGEPGLRPDIDAAHVAESAGTTLLELRTAGDRSVAVDSMARGVARIVRGLYDSGQIRGAICLGGGQGSTIGAAALHSLPVGAPKLIVSTVAAVVGAGTDIIGIRDTTLVNSVVDISGLNSVSRTIIANAAAAMAGMLLRSRNALEDRQAFRVAETMFGVTTRCATRVRRRLEEAGHEVLVFAATGIGDRAMEDMILDGSIGGVVDITTSQLGQGVVRGDAPGGPERLRVAGNMGIPQVASLGGLDIIVCRLDDPLVGEAQLGHRLFHQHSPMVTVVRPTAVESARIGKELATRLSTAVGPTAVLIPKRGFSEYSVVGGPLFDPAADEALIAGVLDHLGADVMVHELDTDINDDVFGDALADTFLALQPRAVGSAPLMEADTP